MSAPAAGIAESDNPAEYCATRAAPPGSTLYYCTLFAAPGARQAALALHAFARELDAVIEECREHGVAMARLGFWAEELGRLGGTPQHPVTRALAAHAVGGELGGALAQVLERVSDAVGRDTFASYEELLGYCRATGGTLAVALASLLQGVQPPASRALAEVGALVTACELLSDLFVNPRRGHLALPRADLERFGTDLEGVYARPSSTPARALGRMHAARLHQALSAALHGMGPQADLPAMERARARIALAGLRAPGRDGLAPLARHAGVSPLRKLWIAWRVGDNQHRRRSI